MNEDLTHPLIVILGPTASGKTAVAIQLAGVLGGEIICADSRTVYCGMDIGTAKPTLSEQNGVPHWGLDLVAPDERFTLYDFQQYVYRQIDDIRARGHVPMLVGGSGLYIDSIVHSYQLTEQAVDLAQRAAWEQLTVPELQKIISERGLTLPADKLNKRRLVRTLELGGARSPRQPRRRDAVVIGIRTDLPQLRQRMLQRADAMLRDGLISEVTQLLNKYGVQEPLKRNAYGVVRRYLASELTADELPAALALGDYHLARKQLTFWRSPYRRDDIWWQSLAEVAALADAGVTAEQLLHDYQTHLAELSHQR